MSSEKIEPVVIKLKYPLPQGERAEAITEIRFERLAIADDFKGLTGKMHIDEQIILASRLAGVPRAIMGKMKSPDMFVVLEALTAFLQPGQETGSESSED